MCCVYVIFAVQICFIYALLFAKSTHDIFDNFFFVSTLDNNVVQFKF